MLNFETSYASIPLHNEHRNVICAKRSFTEKKTSCRHILSKNNIWGTYKILILNIFFNLKILCVLYQITKYNII